MVDGVNQGAIGSYTFTGVTGNHTIHAAFAANNTGSSSSGNLGGGDSSSRRDDITIRIHRISCNIKLSPHENPRPSPVGSMLFPVPPFEGYS